MNAYPIYYGHLMMQGAALLSSGYFASSLRSLRDFQPAILTVSSLSTAATLYAKVKTHTTGDYDLKSFVITTLMVANTFFLGVILFKALSERHVLPLAVAIKVASIKLEVVGLMTLAGQFFGLKMPRSRVEVFDLSEAKLHVYHDHFKRYPEAWQTLYPKVRSQFFHAFYVHHIGALDGADFEFSPAIFPEIAQEVRELSKEQLSWFEVIFLRMSKFCQQPFSIQCAFNRRFVEELERFFPYWPITEGMIRGLVDTTVIDQLYNQFLQLPEHFDALTPVAQFLFNQKIVPYNIPLLPLHDVRLMQMTVNEIQHLSDFQTLSWHLLFTKRAPGYWEELSSDKKQAFNRRFSKQVPALPQLENVARVRQD